MTTWKEYIPDALIPEVENIDYDTALDVYDNENDPYDGQTRGYQVIWTVKTGQ